MCYPQMGESTDTGERAILQRGIGGARYRNRVGNKLPTLLDFANDEPFDAFAYASSAASPETYAGLELANGPVNARST